MAKHTTKKAAKRNPQDATLRNIRAAKKRDAEIERRLQLLEIRMEILHGRQRES